MREIRISVMRHLREHDAPTRGRLARQAIAKKIPGLLPPMNGEYIALCTMKKLMPTLTFKIAGKDFDLTPDDYILEVRGTLCIPSAMPRRSLADPLPIPFRYFGS